MKAVIRYALLALTVWAALELYREGPREAFGGALSGWLEAPAERESGRAASDAFQRAYDKSEQRVDALLANDEAS